MLATLFELYWATLLLATLAGVAHIHVQGCQCIISELGNSLLHLGSRRTWGSPVDREEILYSSKLLRLLIS